MRPIFPQPGYTEADFKELLAGRIFVYVDCFTIRSTDGHVQRYCTAQKNVSVIPIDDPDSALKVTFTSKEVKVSGLKTVVGIGVEVDEQELQLDWSPTQDYLGQPYAAAILRGRFDGAIIRRDRFYARRFGAPWVGGVPMFVGKTSTADNVGRSSATIKVKSDLVLLSINMPHKMYQPLCNWTVFSPGCALNRDDYTQTGTAGAGSTRTVIVPVGITDLDNFALGVIQVQDADAVIQVRTIKEVVGGNFVLAYPLDVSPSEGARFDCYTGCPRTYDICGSRYDNQDHFQAFEYVPKSETAF